jgi:uncharacterized protein (DUF2062 family)
MPFNFSRWIPKRHQIIESRWLAPFREHLHDRRLWRLERYATARGAAIGVFFGFLIPFGQIVFAIFTAVFFRANLAIAAACTLITNPFTFPAVYWLAYKLGLLVTGGNPESQHVDMVADSVAINPEDVVTNSGWLGWMDGAITFLRDAGLPFIVGIVIMAIVGSILAYVLTHAIWQLRSTFRRQRMERNRKKRAERQ